MLFIDTWQPSEYGWETYTNGTSGLSVPMIFTDKYDIYNTTVNYSPPNANTISSLNGNSFTDSPWLTT